MSFDLGKGYPVRKRLRPVSPKRAKVNAIRKAEARRVYGERPVCFACVPWQLVGIDRDRTGCDGWATDLHELLPRGRGGSITDMDNCRPVSRACHDFAHANPELAEAAGLLVPTPSFPRAVPG